MLRKNVSGTQIELEALIQALHYLITTAEQDLKPDPNLSGYLQNLYTAEVEPLIEAQKVVQQLDVTALYAAG